MAVNTSFYYFIFPIELSITIAYNQIMRSIFYAPNIILCWKRMNVEISELLIRGEKQ